MAHVFTFVGFGVPIITTSMPENYVIVTHGVLNSLEYEPLQIGHKYAEPESENGACMIASFHALSSLLQS